jgi:hypothetical protein
MCCDTRSIPDLCNGSVMESYYSAQEACHLSKYVTCLYCDWNFFCSFRWIYFLKACVTLFCLNERDIGTLGSTNLITHINLVPSCCEILKMSVFCSFTVCEHNTDHLDQNAMCEWGSLQRQGNQ